MSKKIFMLIYTVLKKVLLIFVIWLAFYLFTEFSYTVKQYPTIFWGKALIELSLVLFYFCILEPIRRGDAISTVLVFAVTAFLCLGVFSEPVWFSASLFNNDILVFLYHVSLVGVLILGPVDLILVLCKKRFFNTASASQLEEAQNVQKKTGKTPLFAKVYYGVLLAMCVWIFLNTKPTPSRDASTQPQMFQISNSPVMAPPSGAILMNQEAAKTFAEIHPNLTSVAYGGKFSSEQARDAWLNIYMNNPYALTASNCSYVGYGKSQENQKWVATLYYNCAFSGNSSFQVNDPNSPQLLQLKIQSFGFTFPTQQQAEQWIQNAVKNPDNTSELNGCNYSSSSINKTKDGWNAQLHYNCNS